jgi:hypothetical protein
MKNLTAFTVAFLLAACTEVPKTPEETYRAFYRATAEADWDQAVSLMDPAVMKVFRRVGERLAGMVEYEGEPLDFFFRQVKGERSTPLREVSVVARTEGGALLKITSGPCTEDDPCTISEIRMIRHEGRWLVSPELPELLTRGDPGAVREDKQE